MEQTAEKDAPYTEPPPLSRDLSGDLDAIAPNHVHSAGRDVPRCSVCGLPDGPDYGDPHECPPGFLTDSARDTPPDMTEGD